MLRELDTNGYARARSLRMLQVYIFFGVTLILAPAASTNIRVAIYLNLPNNLANETITPRKTYLEQLLKRGLETVGGLDALIVGPNDMKQGEKIEDLARREKFVYYISGEFLPPLGSEWTLTWEIVETQSRWQQPSEWLRHDQAHIQIGAKSTSKEIQSEVSNIKDAFLRSAPDLKRVKVVYISCFLLRATADRDSNTMSALQELEMRLPSHLPGSLISELEKKGYSYRLDYILTLPEVSSLCVKSLDHSFHDQRKRKADYIIEGMITTPDQERTRVSVSVFRGAPRSPVPIEGFERKGRFDPNLITEGLARHIIENWHKVEK